MDTEESTSNSGEIISIEVDDGCLQYEKATLVKYSKFFEAMFSGGYKESNDKTVKIEGVDVHSLKTVLKMMEGEVYSGSTEDVLLILYTASILNFEPVVSKMIDICLENMNPSNCVNILFEAERQNLMNLYCKAMSTALSNFMTIKDTEEFQNFNINQLQSYVGNRYLETQSEIVVFNALMVWWSKNHDGLGQSDLIKVLSNLDVNALSTDDLETMEKHENLEQYPDVRQIISYIKEVKRGNIKDLTKSQQEIAQKLMASKRRLPMYDICMIGFKHDQESPKKVKTSESDTIVVYTDKYTRKRFLRRLESVPSNDDIYLIYYDLITESFKKLIPLKQPHLDKMQGFRILSQDQNILIIGGEFALGKGKWNMPVWMYDSNLDNWRVITSMSRVRRHFQCCIIGNILYIVGGTTNYRIVAEDLYYYDFDTQTWSELIQLPNNTKTSWKNCCEFLDKLAIVQIRETKLIHLFNQQDGTWDKLHILDQNNLIPEITNYNIISNNEKIYIRANDQIIELEKRGEMVVVNKKITVQNTHDIILHCNICSDVVFTMCQDLAKEGFAYSLHMFNLITNEESYIFKDVCDSHLLDVEGDKFKFNIDFKTLKFKHYKMGNNFVNENFR